jgi:DNA-binding SARP family transcriptional activator
MALEAQKGRVRLELLGQFRAFVGEEAIPAQAWPSRRAAELVQLLALANDHRLTRDEVIEALWPHLDAGAGAANLRKAAHHARQALAIPEAVVLRGGQVALFPSGSVETDVARFEAEPDPSLYTGELLPEARYEDWAQPRREALRSRCVELLRRSGDWERLVEVDATDEPAYRELMRASWRRGAARPRSAGTGGCAAPCGASSASRRAPRPGRSTTSAWRDWEPPSPPS